MHDALRIEEILYNIFGHCHHVDSSWTVERSCCTADLAALARTCRTFKEPALDVLWSELADLTPLASCLPDHNRSSEGANLSFHPGGLPEYLSPYRCYSFNTPRNDAEWNTLQSYTHRVWRIVSFSSPNGQLDSSCISATFNTPLSVPLFPNLRFLTWQGGRAALPIIHFTTRSLTCLDIRSAPWEDVSVYTRLLDKLVPQCPNIRKFRIQVAHDVEFGETVHRHLSSWDRLQVIDCLQVTMPADIISQLSCVSTLAWLSFTLNAQSFRMFAAPRFLLVFSRLVYVEIFSESLASVTSLLASVQLPALQVFIIPFSTCPSKATVQSHLSTLRMSCMSSSLTDLRLLNLRSPAAPTLESVEPPPQEYRLNLDDLRPCLTFRNLLAIHINLEWTINLMDADLLTLVSAWPHVEHLVINDRWGWRTAYGITLDGLRQILERCKSLWELCIAINTENVPEMLAAGPLDVDLSLRKPFRLDVADSRIRREDVPALGCILSVLGFMYDSDRFLAWNGSEMENIHGAHEYRYLWRSVFFEDDIRIG